MKHKTIIFILVAFIIVNLFVFFGGRYRRAQNQQRIDEMIRRYERYSGGMTGPTIKAFDAITDRWIAEMKEETVDVTLRKLTDAAEYINSGYGIVNSGDFFSFATDDWREESRYSKDIEFILSNRRFRKAIEDLQKIDRKKAADLLTKNIEENLSELRTMLREDIDKVAQDKHKGGHVVLMVRPDINSYRHASHPDYPPTRIGRRYAVQSYLLLVSFLEIHEARLAVEKAIQFAREEYQFFNSVDTDEAFIFKTVVFRQSLYNPSLLLTATLCDPNWNADKRKLFEDKLVKDREVVDWEARALEHDRDASLGLIPVRPHEKMIPIRYYAGITDAEFNDFFSTP